MVKLHVPSSLATLLKKNVFSWNEAAKQAFQNIKDYMCTTIVLAMPNFNKTFVLGCDTSDNEIGAVLIQEGYSVTFTSKQLRDRYLSKSTYEKEMLANPHAIDIWHPYLMECRFKIKIDHLNLKYVLE
jgi:hypothetical protein